MSNKEIIKMTPQQFKGFMHHATKEIRPESILNTINTLKHPDIIQDTYKIYIEHQNISTVQYILRVDYWNNDINIRWYDIKGEHENIFKHSYGLDVTVTAHTASSINQYGIPCFNTTFKNIFSIYLNSNKTYYNFKTIYKEGIISEVKII